MSSDVFPAPPPRALSRARLALALSLSAWRARIEAAVRAPLLAEVARGELVGGLADAVAKCAVALTPDFPHRPDDKDEIPNGIIFNEP